MSYNPYDNVLATVENAANILGYKPAEYEAVKYPERELSVSVPVRMDDGSVKVFKGIAFNILRYAAPQRAESVIIKMSILTKLRLCRLG